MFGSNQYFGLTRKFVSAFGTLFNDIYIERQYEDKGVSKTKTSKVPITYGSQDKLLARVNSDPELNRKVAALSPAMAFIVSAPVFDSARMINPLTQRKFIHCDGNVSSQFVGVPYNLNFQLYIYANQEEDGLRVLENIIPNFTPSLTVTLKLVPEMKYELDVPIVLNSIDFDNHSDGAMDDRRSMLWTLNFTMKVQFTGPVLDNRKVIKIVNLHTHDQFTGVIDNVAVQPGLTSNGMPTSKLSNTIPYIDIDATDDFGYITTLKGQK